MSFTKTNSNDFTSLKNGIDENIEIIEHKETGFYNITKMCKLIQRMQQSEEMNKAQPARILAGSEKRARDWFTNATTIELIEACKHHTKLDLVHYELAAGTPKLFAGTYVHRFLYDHFMGWLDSNYAMRVSVILDHIHKDAQQAAIIIATKVKDDKIDQLTN